MLFFITLACVGRGYSTLFVCLFVCLIVYLFVLPKNCCLNSISYKLQLSNLVIKTSSGSLQDRKVLSGKHGSHSVHGKL